MLLSASGRLLTAKTCFLGGVARGNRAWQKGVSVVPACHFLSLTSCRSLPVCLFDCTVVDLRFMHVCLSVCLSFTASICVMCKESCYLSVSVSRSLSLSCRTVLFMLSISVSLFFVFIHQPPIMLILFRKKFSTFLFSPFLFLFLPPHSLFHSPLCNCTPECLQSKHFIHANFKRIQPMFVLCYG